MSFRTVVFVWDSKGRPRAVLNESFEPSSVVCGGAGALILASSGVVFSMSRSASSEPKLVSGGLAAHLRVVRVAVGGTDFLALDESGVAWSWNNLSSGSPPRPVSLRSPVASIAAGASFCVVVTFDGIPFAWGRGGHCCFDGDLPRQVPQLTEIADVSCGGRHAIFRSKSGSIFACGANAFGQLGVGDTADRMTAVAVRVASGGPMKFVACGENHSLAASDMVALGWGKRGLHGVESAGDVLVPTPVESVIAFLGQTRDSIASISAGETQSIFLTNSGAM